MTEFRNHLAKDPREQSNVASEHPEQVDRLLRWLRASGALDIELQETVEPMDPEIREQLRALGYGD